VTDGPPPGAEAYEAGVYAPGAPRASALVRLAQRAVVGQPARMLERAGLGAGARVLDAGAGRGRLVAELRRRGMDAEGIEPSARSVAAATAAGLPVARRPIGEHAADGLDAVVLWHVAEHLENPVAALTRVAAWLRPGGLLLVGVPNIDSLQARIGGPSWLHLDAPRHRVHLTPGGLDALFARTGLRPETAQHMVWEHNPAAMWMALLSRAVGVSPGYAFHALKHNARPSRRDAALTVAGLPLLPIAVALEAIAAGMRRGGTIAGLARLSG